MAESLYETLGVAKDSTPDAIRKAYRKLARKLHPDVNPGDAKAEGKFKAVASAYEVLQDEKKRKAYDEFGDDALRGGFDADSARDHARAQTEWANARQRRSAAYGDGAAEFDFADLFGGAQRRGPMRGQDLHAQVELDLRQAIDGSEISIEVPGQGTMRVRIPPGADTGSVIRLAGKGSVGRGGPPGDLVIETIVRPHPRLRREGLDLYLKLPVTLDEAYNGGSVEVPTFHGPVVLKVPARSQTGAKLRLRGKGIARKDVKGDFYVELDVRMPDKADDALATALRASAEAYSAPVRGELAL